MGLSFQMHESDFLYCAVNQNITFKGIKCQEAAASFYFSCHLKLILAKDSLESHSAFMFVCLFLPYSANLHQLC